MKRKGAEIEWFVRQVAEGDPALDENTIARLSAQLGVRFGEGSHYCIAVQYADPQLMVSDISTMTQLYNACVYAGNNLSGNVYCYIGSHMRVVMVVSGNEEERYPGVERLYKSVSRRTAHAIQMGVGRTNRSIEKLNYSRVEAYEVLNSMDANISISYIEDIYARRNITTRKLEKEKRKAVELFKAGKLDQMQTVVAELAENVRMESPVRSDRPYPTSIRRTVAELLAEIMHIASDAGVDVDAILDYQNAYGRIFEMDDTPVILDWFSDISGKLSASISDQENKTESNMMILAKKFIETHLDDPELSLSLVGDELGITPAYFSAFFIREMGVGFNEYITGLRIELARQMLSETNLKINNIASKCGFRSSSYFIVVFRKQTGMSPGEYRNRK